MDTLRVIAPGFIDLNGTRYAISELKSWKDDRINGGMAVALTTKDGHFRYVTGITAADVDRLVSDSLRGSSSNE